MFLKEYLELKNIGYRIFAKKVKVSSERLRTILIGREFPSRKLAMRISDETKGKVSKHEMMFPEDFK